MASLTVRNIPEDAKLRFRQVAAAHGRSMEEHLRQLVMGTEMVYSANETAPLKELRDVPHDFRNFDLPDATGEVPKENWVDELIRLANGADFQIPPRSRTPHIPPEL